MPEGSNSEEEKPKLEKLSPLLVFELVKKRFGVLRDHKKDECARLQLESKHERAQTPHEDEQLERYLRQQRTKKQGLQKQLYQTQQMAEVIAADTHKTKEMRIAATAASEQTVADIKAEIVKLQQTLRAHEAAVLGYREEKAEFEQLQAEFKVRSKEQQQFQEQRDMMKHKLDTQLLGLQAQHLKVPLPPPFFRASNTSANNFRTSYSSNIAKTNSRTPLNASTSTSSN